MSKDLLFIVNPRAGKRIIKNKLIDITDIFIKNGYTVTTYITQGHGDATRYVKKYAENYDEVVCCGGDGTLSETVNGLAEMDFPPVIGYISAGTTNDVGYSLNLPSDMIEAAKVAASGIVSPWDIGKLGDRYFCYVAAFGVFTEITYTTDQAAKNLWGRTAYILEGAKSLNSVKSHHTVIDCDGTRFEGDYMLVMVTNTVSVGGFRKMFGSVSKLNDGLFEVILVKKPRTLDELNHIAALMLQTESLADVKSEFLTFVSGSRVVVTTDDEVDWTADGEFGGRYKDVEIINLKHRLNIMAGEAGSLKEKRARFCDWLRRRR